MEKVDGHVGVYRRTAADSVSTLYISYKDHGKKVWKKIGIEPLFTPAVAKEIRDRHVVAAGPQPWDHGKFKLTLDQAFGEFLTSYVSMQMLRDVPGVVSKYKRHLKPIWGNVLLEDITPAMINRQKIHWLKVIAPSTLNQVMSLLSRIYSALQPRGLGLYKGTNPVLHAKKMEVDNTRLRFLTKQEAAQLMDMLEEMHTPTYRMCAFALYAGLRKTEVLTIRRANVDLDNNILLIRTKDKKQGKMAALPIMPKLRKVIEEMFMEKYFKPNERLFTQTKFNYKTFHQAIDFCRLNDNIDWDNSDLDGQRFKVVFHTLRHSFASHLVADGVPLETVRRLMRHASISVTERYAKVNDQQLKEAINVLNDSWKEADAND